MIKPIIETSTPDGVSVKSWAWSNSERSPIKRILLVNQEGIIVGVASGGIRTSAPETFKHIKSRFVGFQGFATMPAGGILKAYGVISNGKEACPIGF